MAVCNGRGDADGGHCCWVSGKVCEFLVDNTTPGAGRFRCGLMSELGSWDRVHADSRYAPLSIHWKGRALCGDWQPSPGVCCREIR